MGFGEMRAVGLGCADKPSFVLTWRPASWVSSFSPANSLDALSAILIGFGHGYLIAMHLVGFVSTKPT